MQPRWQREEGPPKSELLRILKKKKEVVGE